jgi:flagella synthesis protein FlgN
MHDTNLLQLIIDDFAPAQQLLELLQTESLALHGRDMPLLEEILARKQSLIICSNSMAASAARSSPASTCRRPQGLEQLASQSRLAINCWPKAMC